MGGDKTEACGRCAMSSVIGASDDGTREERNPFAGDRIELSDRELRAVSPSAWLGGLKSRIDELATRLTYGR